MFFKLFSKKKQGSQARSKFEKELYKYLTIRFGYAPNDLSLFVQAFTHKSHEGAKRKENNNERLEFLGDSVLDLIASDYLYQKYPNESEGPLTKMKSNIVSRQSMAYIAKEIDIIDHLRYRRNKNIVTETIEGNAFEALFGAILLDGGYESAERCFMNMVSKNSIDIERLVNSDFDFKSKLLIWSQRRKVELKYNMLSEENKGSYRIYTIQVELNNKDWGKGQGRSKKEAEQIASHETLILLGEISS